MNEKDEILEDRKKANRKAASINASLTRAGLPNLQTTIVAYNLEINERSKEIDPDDGYCWESMAIGWAIAKGMSPKVAINFASYVRYWIAFK